MPKVLLVDDVDLFLELERSYLEGCGYELLTASSGEEALNRLDKVAPDILLLDFYMPGINGDDVCRTIRRNSRWHRLPILMVTAAGKPEEVQKCLDAGCDDYITKPVNKLELREKVARLLGEIKRRTTDRVEVDLPIKLDDGTGTHQGRAEDLSVTGARICCSVDLEENSTIKIAVQLPEGEILSLHGRVKRMAASTVDKKGVYFIHPDQHSKQALDRLVRLKKLEALRREGVDTNLCQRLAALEDECSRLRREQDEAMQRIGELEEENLDFANQLVKVEQVNNNLTNLYLASSRLHSTLDRDETLDIIKEVVINFVGAEKFAILLYNRASNELFFETGEGFEESAAFPVISAVDGVLGEVVNDGENYFSSGSIVDGSDDLLAPIVAIPLKTQQHLIGVLAVYRLFIQKEQLESIDYQLFSMLGEHAATALFSSSLYAKSERKRQTYEGFVDLLTK
ncbi:MAG: response regulator [Desulfuromonadales bacterium]|nr:response regulator [Desulfuromonadales bacterium]